MSTGFNPQYQQYTAQAYSPAPTASAVNIQIFNPTANAAPQYVTQPINPLYQNASFYPGYGQTPAVSYPMNYNTPIHQNQSGMNAVSNEINEQPAAPKEEKKADKAKKEEKKKTKVILTDNYIKSLENYLNNENPKIRLSAATEILERFKEDGTRKTNPALCALLNKVIQDPRASVRYVGLTALDTGYAYGNDETVQILKALETRTDLEYGEDAVLASQILLKLSGQMVTEDVPLKEEA